MGKHILVNVIPEETRMAIVENGQLLDFAVERPGHSQMVGNIFKGKVQNILPGMQAAFVDIGCEKNAFLYLGDLFDPNNRKYHQEKKLSVGQSIIVQVVKDEIGSKGARVTPRIALSGRLAVLMPMVDSLGVSKRVDEQEKERLRKIAGTLKEDGMGLVIRTAAAGCTEAALQQDVYYLLEQWKALSARAKIAQAPSLLFREMDLVIRIARDYLTDDVERVVLDDGNAYRRVCEILQRSSPEKMEQVCLYEEKEELFSGYGIQEQVDSLAKHRVPLKSGGYLVINHTEALTVIDVNSGSYVGHSSLEDTILRVNTEAAAEIARQLVIRDIGGIIIVDFIDMERKEAKESLLRLLKEKVGDDRTKTTVVGLTGLGLVEMTRKRSRPNIDQFLYSPCPCCEGQGRVQSPETVAMNIRRKLRKSIRTQRGGAGILIQTHPQVAEILSRKKEREELEKDLACTIEIEAVDKMHIEVFSILSGKK